MLFRSGYTVCSTHLYRRISGLNHEPWTNCKKALLFAVHCFLYLGIQHMWILPQPLTHIPNTQRTFTHSGNNYKHPSHWGRRQQSTYTYPKSRQSDKYTVSCLHKQLGIAAVFVRVCVQMCVTERGKVCKRLCLRAQCLALIIYQNSFLTLTSSLLS